MAQSQTCAGAEQHGGIEGETSLECCDARISVVKVWEVLDLCLKSPQGVHPPRIAQVGLIIKVIAIYIYIS